MENLIDKEKERQKQGKYYNKDKAKNEKGRQGDHK